MSMIKTWQNNTTFINFDIQMQHFLPSQIQTLLSLPQVAISDPEGDHATDFTSFSCPSSVALLSNSANDKLSLGFLLLS